MDGVRNTLGVVAIIVVYAIVWPFHKIGQAMKKLRKKRRAP